MPHLPRARRNQHTNLRYRVPHRLRVRRFAHVAERCLALTLVLLLPLDILELQIQISEFLGELGHVRAVVLCVRLRLADDDVEVQADVGGREPGTAVVAGQADGVVTGVVRREREPAVRGTASLDYIVPGIQLL